MIILKKEVTTILLNGKCIFHKKKYRQFNNQINYFMSVPFMNVINGDDMRQQCRLSGIHDYSG